MRLPLMRLPRSRRARVAWLLSPLVVICLLLLVVLRVAPPAVDVENQVRRRAIPELEKALGMPIEIGHIESDYLSRVVLHDVVVGRDVRGQKTPFGAHLLVKRVTLGLDFISLVRGADALASLRTITLDQPRGWFERDANGRTNWDSVLKKRAGPTLAWTGRIVVNGGSVAARDDTMRNAQGEALVATAAPLAGVFDVAPEATAFRVSTPLATVGLDRAEINSIALDGRFFMGDAKRRPWLSSAASWKNAPLATLASYAFPRRDVTVRAGRADGSVLIAYDGAKLQTSASPWLASGALQLRTVAGEANALRAPNGAVVPFTELSGPLKFTGAAARSEGLTFRSLGSPFRLSGTAALDQKLTRNSTVLDALNFDVVVESRALASAPLLAAVRPLLPRDLAVQSGIARATMRLSGTRSAFIARARMLAPDAAVRNADLAARVAAPDLTLSYDSRTRRATGQIRAALLDATSRQGSARARGFLSNFALASDARSGAVSQLRARFAAAGWNARTGAPNAAAIDGKDARGAVFWAPSANSQTFAVRLNAGAAAVNAANVSGVRGIAARGVLRELVVRGNSRAGKTPLVLDVSLDNWAGRGSFAKQTGALRGRTLHLLAQTPDVAANSNNWRGALAVSGIAANEIQLAAFAPSAAQALRAADVSLPGVLDATINFAPGANRAFVATGQARLSRARVAGEDVRNLVVLGRFDGARWNLALTQAQSAYGTLAGWVRGGLSGAPTFAFDIPRLRIPAATVNRLLAPQGLALDGITTARLRIEPAGDGKNGGAESAVRTRFSLNLPNALLRSASRAQLLARLENATLRGGGVLHFNSAAAWRFEGAAQLGATRVLLGRSGNTTRGLAVPAALGGAAVRGVRMSIRGAVSAADFARTAAPRLVSVSDAPPKFAGDFTWTRATFPLPAPAGGMASDRVRSKSTVLPALTFAAGRAIFLRDARGWRVPRFSTRAFPENGARAADSARLRGWVSLAGTSANSAFAAQVLAERMDAARVQNLVQNALGPRAQLAVKLRGTSFVRLDVMGTANAPRAAVDMRLVNGALETGGRTLPLDSARMRLDISRSGANVREAVMWSRGARLALAGAVSATGSATGGAGSDMALNLSARADDVRLTDAAALVTNAASDVDGLASGEFLITGSLARPRVTGRTDLKLATAFGITMDTATARVNYESTPDGPRLAIEDIEGRSGETRLAGRFLADVPADQWHFALTSEGLDTSRILQTGRRALATNNASALPLRGELAAQIDVRGRFGERFALVPIEGGAEVRAASLRWRGRNLGALNVNATLDGKKLRIEDFSLRDPQNPASPTLVVSGSAPLIADAQGLDVHLQAQRARLELVRVALDETRRTLRNNARAGDAITAAPVISLANLLDTLLNGWNALPQKLDGIATLDAQFSGSLVAPVAELTAQVREAKLGNQPLPTLDAALHIENGAATVRTLELKQIEAAAQPDAVKPDDDPRETTLRFSEGGRITANEISLDGELLNANLSQLAPWVRSLRNVSGGALLEGEVSLFNFQLRGSPQKPLLTGSLEAQDLTYRAYTLDRLRLARFEIQGDSLVVEPGNFTVVKGGFQSSAPWGRLPWNWTRGIDFDRAVDVHLPVQRRDFGAIAGAFLPALRAADAEGFDGTIDIQGTLAQPRFSGEVVMRDVRFATDAVAGADVGVRGLTGALRFGQNNTLQLDNVHGELARATDVEATATGNRPSTERGATTAKREAAKNDSHFAGAFALNGSIGLRLEPEDFVSAARVVAAQRFDVALNVSKGAFWRSDISGVRDATLDIAWKTGAGAEETAQRVTWQFAAAGRDTRGGTKGGGAAGTVRSAGTAQLALENIARSRWNGTVSLRSFAFNVMGAARGKLDGDLELVNIVPRRATARVAEYAFGGFSLASLEERLRIARTARRTARDGDANADTDADARGSVQSTVDFDRTRAAKVEASARVAPTLAQQVPAPRGSDAPDEGEAVGGVVPGVGGVVPGVRGSLVVSETEITGAPVGTVGVARLLPPAPAFDIRVLLGREVRFNSPTLRAEFAGGLQVSGTPRDPSMVGTLLARDGQIRFPAASARITTAEVDVNLARDPASGLVRSSAVIDATARGQAGRYAITLRVRGPLDFGSNNAQQLKIEVSSNPPLSQDEAFARLTGTSIRDLQNAGAPGSEANQAYASAFLSVLSAPLFSGIERTLEDALGLSSITLDYRLSEPLSVQFGKAVGDRVYVSYRRSISGNRPGEPTRYELRVDYRIRGDYQLGVQIDERNRQQITLEKTFRF